MLRAERRASVECIWLERPAQHNALVPELLEALREHLVSLQSAPPSAVVLSGAGPDFCVGADVRWMDTWRQPAEGVALLVAAQHAAVAAMRATPAPIVAAINGAAAGGGLSLALAADVRVAAGGATFTAAWARLGLPPDGGASAFLVRGIGANRALELLLGNRSLSAEQALDWGLVNRLAPDAELIDDACTFAHVARRRPVRHAAHHPPPARRRRRAAARNRPPARGPGHALRRPPPRLPRPPPHTAGPPVASYSPSALLVKSA